MKLNQEIRQLADMLIKELPRLISMFMGKKLKLETSSIDKEEFENYLVKLITNFKDIHQLTKKGVTPPELFKAVDNQMHLIIPVIPKDQRFTSWFTNFIDNKLEMSFNSTYLESTIFNKYKTLLTSLIWKILDNFQMNVLANKFIKQVDRSQDILFLGQTLHLRLLKHYNYLQKEKLRITRKTVEKHIQIYGDLSGCFEKQLRTLVGLLEILRKSSLPDYNKISKRPLAENEKIVKQDTEYADLVKPFNRIIRNAIAHESYLFLPEERKITFIDRSNKCSYEYSEFINQVRELSSLVFTFSQIRLILSSINLKVFEKLLEVNR